MYEKQLRRAGLTEKQAQVYLACLELGKAKASEIAKRSGIKRSTTYAALDELAALGLVSIGSRGRLRFYRAQDPSAILNLIDNAKSDLEKTLPKLQNLFLTNNPSPLVEFFEGNEGIKRIYEDSLRCKSKKIYQIVKVEDFKAFPGKNFSKQYIHSRVRKGITAYALHPKSGDFYDETYGTESKALLRHVRYLPPMLFHASMIMLYDKKVAMISTRKENFGFIIESKEFSNTQKAQFDYMWQMGSKEHE